MWCQSNHQISWPLSCNWLYVSYDEKTSCERILKKEGLRGYQVIIINWRAIKTCFLECDPIRTIFACLTQWYIFSWFIMFITKLLKIKMPYSTLNDVFVSQQWLRSIILMLFTGYSRKYDTLWISFNLRLQLDFSMTTNSFVVNFFLFPSQTYLLDGLELFQFIIISYSLPWIWLHYFWYKMKESW